MKKKIVIIHHCDELGGAGISLFHIYNMLKENYDVKLYVPHIDSEIADFLIKQDIVICAFGDKVGMISSYSGGPKVVSRTFVKNILKTIDTKKYLKRILNQENPDIVAINSMTLAWAGKQIQKSKAKSICFVRETSVNNFGFKYIKHFLNNWFDGVIFISEYDRRNFKCKALFTGVVHDCIDKDNYSIIISREEACRHLNIEKNMFNVLFVGGMDELKGWSVINAAMEKLKNYDIHLVVAGNVKKEKIKEKSNITFIGSRTDMPCVYRACDVLIFPSTSPHQARPVFEAGMMGLPVIISDFEETREFVRNGENGLTILTSNSDDIAEKILKLYVDRELCKKLGQTNQEYAIQFHEFKNCMKTLADIMKKIDIEEYA